MGIAQRLGDLFKLRPLLWVMTIGDQVAALQDELGVQADDLLDDPLVGDWVGARIAVSDEGELLGGQGGPGRDTLGFRLCLCLSSPDLGKNVAAKPGVSQTTSLREAMTH